jgi:hypothetical protein
MYWVSTSRLSIYNIAWGFPKAQLKVVRKEEGFWEGYGSFLRIIGALAEAI